jgi:hypothetical protein
MAGGGMIAALYFIFFFLIYLPLSVWVIRKSYRFAKARYQRGWAGGVIAAFIMYNLVFWDWIPVVLMHKHLCETEGGFWVYKTPEQWVKEHPEVVGQDWSISSSYRTENIRKDYGNTLYRHWFGSAIYFEHSHRLEIDFTKTIAKNEDKVVDAQTGKTLFRSTNFRRFALYKLWLADPGQSEGPGCSVIARDGADNEFSKLMNVIKPSSSKSAVMK